MVDITIVATGVTAGPNSVSETGLAAVSITAGKAVAYDPAVGAWKLADCDDATPAIRMSVKGGIALNAATAGQPVTVLRSGDVTTGSTLTAGIPYYLSSTPGGICPLADITVGKNFVYIGTATTTAILNVNIFYTGVQA